MIKGGLISKGLFRKKSDANTPLVSIITPCLNSEQYIEQTIKSVLGQTYDNIEYIIIDGSSTDSTLSIIKKYDDYLAYWVSEPDSGLFDAMNKGIALATGEWVGIINSDDWYHTNAVEWVIKAYRNNPTVDVFHGDLMHLRIDGGYVLEKDCEDGRHFRRKGHHSNMIETCGPFHPTCFVKRKVYSEYKFNPRIKYGADYSFMLSLFFANKKFCYIPEPIAYFRPVGQSSKVCYRPVLECLQIRSRYSFLKALKMFFLETKEYIIAFLFVQKRKIIG